MIPGGIARRYAKALADVAASTGELEAVQQELSTILGLLRENQELRQFLANPSILRRDKAQVFAEVIAGLDLRPLTRTFLRILVEAGRLTGLESVLRAYEALVDERMERIKAVVTAAGPLEVDAQERLRRRLQEMTGKAVYLEVRQDPGILGGLVAQVGSQVYDGSVKTQLVRLREELLRG